MSLSVLFLAFFGSDIKMEVGVVIYIYLNQSLDNIDSKYKWVHVSNSLSSSVFAEIPILAFLALHMERKGKGVVSWFNNLIIYG